MKDALIGIELINAIRTLADAAGLKVPEGDIGLVCPECHKPVMHVPRGPGISRREISGYPMPRL